MKKIILAISITFLIVACDKAPTTFSKEMTIEIDSVRLMEDIKFSTKTDYYIIQSNHGRQILHDSTNEITPFKSGSKGGINSNIYIKKLKNK